MDLSKKEAIRLYIALIRKRIKDPIIIFKSGETELHHILPKCLLRIKFLQKSKYNLVRLRAHEHLLAHYYLAIIFKNNLPIQIAFYLMSNQKTIPNHTKIGGIAQVYEHAKKAIAKEYKDKNYIKRYGKTKAERIKDKQKLAKLDQLIRFIPVDK